MKLYTFFIAALMLSSELFGQKTNTYDYFLRNVQMVGSNESKIVIDKETGDTTFQAFYNSRDVVNNTHQEMVKTYKGTPFFKNGWYKGTISTENSKNLEFLMAFNVQKNELYVVKDPNQDAITIKPESFTIAGHHFSQFEKTYFEVIYISKNTLLKEYSCNLNANGMTQKTGYEVSGGYEGEFMKTSKYFILKNDEVVQLPKGKQMLKVFDNKKIEVEKFVKENDINLKSENGIVSVFKFYNSLENPL